MNREPATLSDSAQAAAGTIQAVLSAIRRRRLRQAGLSAAGWAAACAALAALLLLLVVGAGGRGMWMLWAAVGIGVAAAAVLTWFTLGRAVWRTNQRGRLAAAADRTMTGDHVLTAVELLQLARHDPMTRWAQDRLESHLQRTAQQILQLDLRRSVPWRRAEQLAAAGPALLAVVAVLMFLPGMRARVAGALQPVVVTSNTGGPAQAPQLALRDVEVIVEPPPYTGEAQRILPGGSGAFSALPGTTVTVSARVGAALDAVTFQVGDGPWLSGEVVSGESIRLQFVVGKQNSYRIEAKPAGDSDTLSSGSLPILLQRDARPSIQLLDPPAGVVELDTGSELKLTLEAGDDYGLTRVDRVFRRDGAELARTTVVRLEDDDRSATLETRWTPGEQTTWEGGEVELTLEVYDNDTVSGPKGTATAPVRVRTLTALDRHGQTLTARRQLLEAALLALGEHLLWLEAVDLDQEDPSMAGRAVERMAVFDEAAQQLVAAQANDPMPDELGYAAIGSAVSSVARSRDVLRQRKRQRETGRRGTIGEFEAALVDLVQQLERTVLVLDKLVKEQQWEDALRASRDVASAIQALEQALESGDAAAIEAAYDELMRAQSQLGQRLASMDQGLAREMMNPQEDGAGGTNAQLQQLIAEGRTEEALALLAEQAARLARLEKMRQQLGEEGVDAAAMLAKLDEILQLAGELEDRQRNLNDKMAELDGASTEGSADNAEHKNLRSDVAALRKQVEALGRSPMSDRMQGVIDDRLQRIDRHLENTDLALERGDMDRALQGVAYGDNELLDTIDMAKLYDEAGATGMTDETFARWLESMLTAEAAHRDLVDQILKEDRKQAIARTERSGPGRLLSPKQRAVAQGAKELGGQMNDADLVMLQGEEQARQVATAEQLMRAAAGDLDEGEAGRARGSGQEAVAQLEQFQQHMEQMRDAIQQGGASGSIPLGAMADRPWQYFHGNEGTDVGQGLVDIPPPDRFSGPEELRRAAMEAAIEDAPPEYRPLNDAYYEELLR